jgi:hypothetical protein
MRGRRNTHAYTYSYCDSGGIFDSNSNSVPHVNAVANSYVYTAANSYANTNPKSYSYSYTHGNPERDTHPDPSSCLTL